MSGSSARSAVLSAVVLFGLAGCTGPQHALEPAGPDAARITELWWVMLWSATAVTVIVAVALAFALRSALRRSRGREVREVDGRVLVWGGGVILPVLILFPLLVYSFRVARQVYPPMVTTGEPLTIEVAGHQFWWEVRYAQSGFATANEIRIPVGEPVRFLVHSPDVIHSFWIPRLHGKMDMIPGRMNELWVRADEPGSFRGQCAEYCGMGHALMAFWVEAVPADEFRAWLEHRTAAGVEPLDEEAERGREVFFAAGCGHCHAIPGEPLAPELGTPGPDLTGLAERRTLAAGTLPNSREALADWIADPQRIKPGSRMPATELVEEEMNALLAYLGTLR